MRAVNLLPAEERRSPRLEGLRTPLLVAAGGIAALTTGAVFLTMSASGTADERRTELAAIEAAIARLPKAPDPAVSQGVLLQERSDRVAALSAALTTRVAFDRVLREIALVLPEDAWLTGLTATAPVSATPLGGSEVPPASTTTSGAEGITIEGATYTYDSVARVLSRLSVAPSLENVRLMTSTRTQPEAADAQPEADLPTTPRRPIVTFTLAASLRSTEASR
jgi:Tfp pilus assembly protein PilN